MLRDQIIQRVMSTKLVTINVSEPIKKAIQLLNSNNMHHLPVVDEGKLVGIISSSDLFKLKLCAKHTDAGNVISLERTMTRNPHTITITDSLRNATDVLSDGNYHSLPVVDHKGHLVGIVTSSDLLKHLFMGLPRGDGSLIEERGEGLHERIRVLEDIRHASQQYLNSGHAEQEHKVLLEKLAFTRNDNVTI